MKAMLGVMLGVAAGFGGAALAVQSGWVPPAEAQAGLRHAGAALASAAQAGPAGGAGAGQGQTILATGGSTQNQNDLCWVLTRVKPVRGPERMVLALYRADKMGDHFTVRSVRWIDPDLRAIEFSAGNEKLDVKKVLNALPQEEKEALRPPQNP